MRQFATRRLVLMLPTLVLVSLIIFAINRLIPGDVAALMTEEFAYAPDVEAMRERLGHNQPIYVQYIKWMGGLFQGDFGRSLWNGESIIDDILIKFPITLELAVLSLIITFVTAIPLGIYSAIRQDTALDYLGRSAAVLFLSVPHFWIATLILIFPAYYLGWAPTLEWTPFTENPIANLQHMLIPALIIGLHGSASLMRLTRAMMLEVLRQDFIRTAWSKGLRERIVNYRHALKNAMIPVLTFFGLRIPSALGGTVIMESIFGIPGLGRWILDAIILRDYPQLQAAVLFLALNVLVTNLLVDLVYGWLDPRIRYA